MSIARARTGSVFNQDDRDAILAEVKRLGAKSVLEFGPGFSTWTFIDAGCEKIDSLEYDDKWLDRAKTEFSSIKQVSVSRYKNTPEIALPDIDGRRYDIAFVDSPRGSGRSTIHPGQEGCSRFNTTLYACGVADIVLLHDAKRPMEQETLRRIAATGRVVEMIDTEAGIARIRC